MLQNQTETLRIGGAIDPDARAAEFDLNAAAVTTNWLDRLFDSVGNRHSKQSRCWRSFVEPAFTKQLPPVKDLIRIHSMTTSHHRYRSTWLQRFFGNPSPLLLRAMPPPDCYINNTVFYIRLPVVPHCRKPLLSASAKSTTPRKTVFTGRLPRSARLVVSKSSEVRGPAFCAGNHSHSRIIAKVCLSIALLFLRYWRRRDYRPLPFGGCKTRAREASLTGDLIRPCVRSDADNTTKPRLGLHIELRAIVSLSGTSSPNSYTGRSFVSHQGSYP